MYNPAFVGEEGRYKASLMGSIYARPFSFKSWLVNYEQQVDKINSGIGFMARNNVIGALEESDFSLLYNYRIQVKENQSLRVGANLTYFRESYDFSLYQPVNPSDQLLSNRETVVSFPVGLGLFYKTGNLEIGIAGNDLLAEKTSSIVIRRNTRRTFNASLGYRGYQIGDGLSSDHSLLWQYVYNDHNFQFSNSLNLIDLLKIGFAYRKTFSGWGNSDAVYLNGGVCYQEKVWVMINVLAYQQNPFFRRYPIEGMLKIVF